MAHRLTRGSSEAKAGLHPQGLSHLVSQALVLDLAEELVHLFRAHLSLSYLLTQGILLISHDLVLNGVPLEVSLQLSQQVLLLLLFRLLARLLLYDLQGGRLHTDIVRVLSGASELPLQFGRRNLRRRDLRQLLERALTLRLDLDSLRCQVHALSKSLWQGHLAWVVHSAQARLLDQLGARVGQRHRSNCLRRAHIYPLDRVVGF